VAVVCAVALAGCGSHPGAAAQVGDVSVSDEQLQRSTGGFCDLIEAINAAQQGASPPVPVRSALLSALNTLVMGVALDHLAAQNDVEVTPAEVRGWVSALPLDLTQVPPSRAEDLQAVTDRVARNALLVEELGRDAYARQNPGGAGASPEQVQRLGQQLANDYLQRVDVETDPRYGQVLDTSKLPGTGSLSIAVSEAGVAGENVPEADSTLAASQECS
jgi:hypothetical protein